MQKAGSPMKELRYIPITEQKEWRVTKILEERTKRVNGAADKDIDEVKRNRKVHLVTLVERRRRRIVEASIFPCWDNALFKPQLLATSPYFVL